MGCNIAKQKKTQKLIRDAFMSKYAQKNYSDITVKEICENAGIHRSTFYLHYENIDNLLREIEDLLLDQIKEASSPLNRFNFEMNKNGEPFFNNDMYNLLFFYQQNKDYVIPLLSPYGNPYFVNKLKKLIMNSFIESLQTSNTTFGDNQKYVLIYLASGIIDTIYAWLKNNDKSLEELTVLFMKMNYMNPTLLAKNI